MGTGKHILVIIKDIRKKIGKEVGDAVKISLELDTEPREIDIPQDFSMALAEDAAAQETFEKLSFSHRREYILWINEAKKEETRSRRISKAIEMMPHGRTLK